MENAAGVPAAFFFVYGKNCSFNLWVLLDFYVLFNNFASSNMIKMKRLLKALTAVFLMTAMVFAAGCHKDPIIDDDENGNGDSGGGTTEGMYLGIIGFNDQLKTKPIGLLNTSTENSFINFINDLEMRDGTALYHADYTALNWLQTATLPSDLINVSIVTFTDGLDNASMMLNDNFNSQTEYLNAINNRIRTDKVGGLSIDAYAIGMKGNDVQDEASFRQNLQKLSSSPANVFEVENMEYVTLKFREIASSLNNETTTIVGTMIKVPGGYDNNTLIRITFDNVNNGNSSSKYIEATYTRENGQGKLNNINYYGLQSTSGSVVMSDRLDGACYWYTFADLKTPDGTPVTNTANMKLWRYISSTAEWQSESEFAPSSYSDVQVERKSAMVILVLDCTTSLGDDYGMMKTAAGEFVRMLNHFGDIVGGDDEAPTVTTADVSNITNYSARCGGTIIDAGGSDIAYCGVCWSQHENPTLNDNFVYSEGLTTNQFTCLITELEGGMTYYVRAFAMNGTGVGYGEQKVFTTGTGGGGNSDIPIGRVYTIDEILQLEPGSVFQEPASVYGIVTADEASGNLIKASYLQDRRTGKAIQLFYNNPSNIRIGDSIRVCLEGVMFSIYNNLPQLTYWLYPEEHFIVLASNRPIEPTPATITGIQAGMFPAGSLVRLENVVFTEHTTFADLGHSTYGNRILADINNLNNDIIVRTSNYADFASDSLPNRACNLTAIASIYATTWQLILRDRNDIEEFGDPFPDPGNGGVIHNLPYVQSFNSGFGSYMTYDVLGAQSWEIDYCTAKMSGYVNSTNYANEDWLISSPVAITGVSDAKIVIEYIGRYFNNINNEITIWASTNYTLADNPNTAIWRQLPVTLSEGNNWSNFITSEISLTEYVGQTVTIAVKYTSTDSKAGTIEIQKISIVEGVAAPEPPISETQHIPYTQSFAYEFGTYMTYNVSGAQNWVIDYSTAKMTGYMSGVSYDNEDWLISSPVEITGVNNAKMTMMYIGRYFENINEDVTVWVSTNYNFGDNPTTATWRQLSSTLSVGGDWSTFFSTEIDMNAYVGQTVVVAVKYLSTSSQAGTIEIKSISIEEGNAVPPGISEGSGTANDPYNVAAGRSHQNTSTVAWVRGYIVGAVKSGVSSVTSNNDINWSAQFDLATNVVIADNPTCREIDNCIIVNLPAGKPLRTEVNLVDHPENYGKRLTVLGTLRSYFGKAGMRDSEGTEDDFVLEE